MKINNLSYLLKEGIKGIFTHGFMSFAAVCVTVACLLIVGSFSLLMYNVNIMVEDLNKTNEVLVFIDDSLSEAEAKSVGTKINVIENVHQATFVTREEALEDFVSDHQDSTAFNGVAAEDLRHRFVVVLQDNEQIAQTVDQIRQISGVADIRAEYELAEGFSTMEQVIRIVSIGVISVLLVVSLLIISNTVKLAMYDRRDEIAIMKMVGATNGFIRLPFVVEGFTLGMMGAALAFGIEWLMYDALATRVREADTLQLFTFVPFQQLLYPMIAVFCFAGLFVGIVGSWTSIRKFLDV
ncbi:MAG: permease-like cell division protein FtsX [Oscillospiraceae bacterium]|nr:permease-like cell division protein FtsX [Oscillospiraceae bacterium]